VGYLTKNLKYKFSVTTDIIGFYNVKKEGYRWATLLENSKK
jgi:hypothetical protein